MPLERSGRSAFAACFDLGDRETCFLNMCVLDAIRFGIHYASILHRLISLLKVDEMSLFESFDYDLELEHFSITCP